MPTLEQLDETHPALLVVNCARCHELLIGESEDASSVGVSGMRQLYCRVRGKPFCESCARPKDSSGWLLSPAVQARVDAVNARRRVMCVERRSGT